MVAEVTVLAKDPLVRKPTDPHKARVTFFDRADERKRILETTGSVEPTRAAAEDAAQRARSALDVLGIEVV
jgi:hypothetical protein